MTGTRDAGAPSGVWMKRGLSLDQCPRHVEALSGLQVLAGQWLGRSLPRVVEDAPIRFQSVSTKILATCRHCSGSGLDSTLTYHVWRVTGQCPIEKRVWLL